MKWWEKTVEYSFVCLAIEKDIFNLLLPLDGDVESIGDAVLGKDSEFFVVEFKRSLSDLSREYEKYSGGKSGYLAAAKEMKDDPSSRAHFLVGGRFLESQSRLSIEARRYFEVDGVPIVDIAAMFNAGLSLEQLKEYTRKITSLKKTEEGGEGNASSSGSYAFANVLAVSKEKKKASLIPLSYFNAPLLKNEPQKKRALERRRGPR